MGLADSPTLTPVFNLPSWVNSQMGKLWLNRCNQEKQMIIRLMPIFSNKDLSAHKWKCSPIKTCIKQLIFAYFQSNAQLAYLADLATNYLRLVSKLYTIGISSFFFFFLILMGRDVWNQFLYPTFSHPIVL